MSKEHQRGPETIEHIAEIAQEVLLRDSVHKPTLLIHGDEGHTSLQIEGEIQSAEVRAYLMHSLGKDLAMHGGIGNLENLYLVSEGWLSTPDASGKIKEPPSQDPERVEILFVAGIDIPKNKTQMLMFEMIRNDDGEIHDLLAIEPPEKGGITRAFLLEKFVDGYREARTKQ